MELDVFSTIEREDKFYLQDDENVSVTRSAGKSLKDCWIKTWRENWFFLILLSLTSACVILMVDVICSKLLEGNKI